MQSSIERPPATSQKQRDRIIALARGSSVETSAHEAAIDDTCRAGLPLGTDVYITALSGDSLRSKMTAAQRLRDAGFNPVPHLGARHIASTAQLDELLSGLVAGARVEQLLVIGGDADVPAGPFRSSLDLLESGALERHGIRRVGLAAYPEGHPRIGGTALDRALAAKIARLRHIGIAPYVVTQFCFEAPPLRNWLRCFGEGQAVPVRIGLAGPAKLMTLIKYAARCSVGASLRALTRGTFRARLLADAGPEPLIRALADVDFAPQEIAGLHLFTFGGIARTSAWLAAMARGDFEISLDGKGFDVRT